MMFKPNKTDLPLFEPFKAVRRHRVLTVAVPFFFLLMGVALMEAACRVFFPWWNEVGSNAFFERTLETVGGHGIVLVGRPNFSGWHANNDDDFRVRVELNDMGHRTPLTPMLADGHVWVVGDSYTFGWGVEERESYAAVAGQLANVGTYNLALGGLMVCGYQAHLRRLLRQGVTPGGLVVGITIENDVLPLDCERHVRTVAKASKHGFIEAKHWFLDHSAFYVVVTFAIKSSPALHDAFIDWGLIADPVYALPPHIEDVDAAVHMTLNEVGRLRSMVPRETPFAILIVGCRMEPLEPEGVCAELRAKFVGMAELNGYFVVDPSIEIFALGIPGFVFEHDGHWTAAAHRIAGEALAPVLESWR